MAEKFKPCSVSDCNGNAHYSVRGSKGFCPYHYQRFRRNGDPLVGKTKTRNGEPMRFIHEIAVTYQGMDCLIWPFSIDSNGYGDIRVDGKTQAAHRYICELTKGPPPTPGHEAAHSCGKGHRGCVSQSHLRWATNAENAADKLTHGTDRRGEKTPSSKLKSADIPVIRASLKAGVTHQEIASDYGVCRSTITAIAMGTSWGWLE